MNSATELEQLKAELAAAKKENGQLKSMYRELSLKYGHAMAELRSREGQ